MKKLYISQYFNNDGEQVFEFPFDSIKEHYSGKPLTEDEELRQQRLMSNLKEAMGLFIMLDKSFFKFPLEPSREYFTVETFFKNQCEKKKESDPTFDIEVFAECEKERIESIMEQVKQLTDKSYYSKVDTYEQAKKYIKYLDKVIKGQIQENEPEDIEPKYYLLLKFDRDNVNKITIDNVLKKCKENLLSNKFSLQDYTALYLVIYTKYLSIFKLSTNFSDVQKWFDEYFKKDTRTYKPGKVKYKADDLKKKYLWIDTL